ncbi:MAG TPA: phage terminase large subunit [Planctomycetota bacterium]|nr:phage terminase large subunit [Planctomycetota bacterium]
MATVDVQAPDPERDARVEHAGRDPMFFAQTYLAHYFTDEPCDFHRELIGLLFGTDDDLVCAAPRGHAKSTLAALLYPLYQVLFRRVHYVVIIRKTMTDAEEALDAIRHELETNEQLIADFGSMVTRGKTRAILLRTDSLIVAKTRGSKVRGTRFRQYRPDLIIGDDLEDDDHIDSPIQREKDERWFNSAISNATGPDGRTVVIGTILHAHSLLAKLLANASYVTRKFRAVLDWPQRGDLWETWRSIFQDLMRGKESAREFLAKHRKRMLDGARVLWPSRLPFARLMELRERIGSLSFEQELQNNPLDPDSQLYREEWIQYYADADLINVGLVAFGACDPSIGQRMENDEAAIVSVARGSDGRIYVLDVDSSRRSMLATTAAVLRKHVQWRYAGFAIETNAYQQALAENVAAESLKQKVYPPVVEIKQYRDKRTRLASKSPLVENGTVRFKREHWRLIEQLVGFPKWDRDDIADAFEMAVDLAVGGGGPIEFAGSGRKFRVAQLEEDGNGSNW